MSHKRVKPTADNAHFPRLLPAMGRFPLSAEFVVDWINNGGLAHWHEDNEDNPLCRAAMQRITELIRAFQALPDNWSDPPMVLSDPSKPGSYTTQWPGHLRMVPRINDILREYVLTPYVIGASEETTRWSVKWLGFTRESWIGAGEMEVLQQILTMAVEGTLGYLAVCGKCGKWFVRRRLDQVFCSAECRNEFRRSSPAWKKHRRKYMRKYYRLKLSGHVK